ncbi:DEAD/DEAH box helicase [Candidatus Uabimicrobium sp. HlEnr_7]|uniref:DEAD/DEAH box helicase n=1 Tax=Candidatus Uabimicrobium helgolandensis TaxID=3095367 RepID=UPI0035588E85
MMKAKLDKYKHKIIKTIDCKGHPGDLCSLPEDLHTDLKLFLISQNIKKLYSHQLQMYRVGKNGQNAIITTATASGKTISFLLPILQRIIENPGIRVLLLYPTKALAQDQMRNLEPILDYFGRERIEAGVYDGDTPPNERTRIRQRANLILTNPEMVHGSFLPNHSRYGFNNIFSKLTFVVIDELHVYRGAFGSHMANVMRRLHRVCKYYKSAPQFLLSSATIANPLELAKNVCHRNFVLIDKDGSPSYQRKILLWQPPFVGDSPYRKKPEEEAATLIPDLVCKGDRFITFCQSRRQVEVVLKETRDQLLAVEDKPSLMKDLGSKVSGYRGGYTKKERKQIEKKLATGHLYGVISTNALELGIDIGDLEVVLLCGFPSTKASFWQQVGRAGRKSNSVAILFLDVGSVDQYIALNSDYLTDREVENAIIDKNNLFIQLAHIRAAAAELPITLEDAAIFPDLGESIPVLLKAQELKNEHGNFHWNGKEYPAGDFSLRNTSQHTYKVVHRDHGIMITEMDESQAFREAYPKAIYIHDGLQYMVEDLDLENRIVRVFSIDVNYFTVPFVETDVAIIKDFRSLDLAHTSITFGDVKVTETVVAYKMVQFHNHQNLGYESIDLRLVQELETEAIWYKIPQQVVTIFETHREFNFYRGLQHALLTAARMRTMATTEDMSATFFTNVKNYGCDQYSYILLYDLYPSGLGFTEKAFDFAKEILLDAISLVQSCRCEHGCPACVGDYFLDRDVVCWGLNSMQKQTTPPVKISGYDLPPIPKEKKQFQLEELSGKWQEFVEVLSTKGEKLGEFLAHINTIKVEGNVLKLSITSEFLAQWILEKENKKKIEKTISYYVVVPQKFCIDVFDVKSQDRTIEKIMRRYDNLKKIEN